MALADADLRAIILLCDSDGVLAQLVERLNGIEEFLLLKYLEIREVRLLCHKLVSQWAKTGSPYGAA
jgi:hypothetical protein